MTVSSYVAQRKLSLLLGMDNGSVWPPFCHVGIKAACRHIDGVHIFKRVIGNRRWGQGLAMNGRDSYTGIFGDIGDILGQGETFNGMALVECLLINASDGGGYLKRLQSKATIEGSLLDFFQGA